MIWSFVVVFLFGGLISALVILASKSGSKSAQLEALKEEIKRNEMEQERAKKIKDNVYAMSADDARRRLCKLQSKQR